MDIQSLILNIFGSEKSKLELEQLKSWKEESEENLAAYQEMIQIQNESKNLDTYKDFDVDKAYAKFTNSKPKSSNNLLKLAIILLLFALIGLFVKNKFTSEATTPQTYFIADSGVINIELQDHSKIDLNNGASLEQKSDFEGNERIVELKGEAFFDIAKDAKRPFKIELSNGRSIEVLGTSFNVFDNGENLEVTVYSGKVAFNTGKRIIVLTKGDRVSRIEGSFVKYQNDDENTLSWKSKTLVFKDAKLVDVFDDLAKHYNVEFNGIKENNCRFTSKFTNESIDQVLAELTKIVGLKFQKNDALIQVKSISCE